MNQHIELVSIIIPTKNRSHLLKRAVKSALEQTWPSLDIIIVNDYSTDDTLKILSEFSEFNLKVINNKTSFGGAVARNIGIEAAQGFFIAFLDDDDTWEKDKIAKQIECFKSKQDASAITCSYYSVDGKDKKEIVRVKHEPKKLLNRNFLGGTSMYLTTKENLKKISGFDPLLKSGQDWDLMIRLNELGKIYVVDKPLVNYYEHNEIRITNILSTYSGRKLIFFKYRNKFTRTQYFENFSDLLLLRMRIFSSYNMQNYLLLLSVCKNLPFSILFRFQLRFFYYKYLDNFNQINEA